MTSAIDPPTLEILRNGLSSVADEMALVVLRSAYSPIVRDSMDFSTAVFDHDGRVIAQGLTLAIHLGAFPGVMKRLVTDHAQRAKAGDLYILNDPYTSGGMHLPDIYLIAPVFHEGRLEGYVATIVHHSDIGGMSPGSMNLAASDIYQEGLRIPLLKLFDEGSPNRAVFSLLETNSRMPTQLLGDLRAQIASCRAGSRGIQSILAKLGSTQFRRYVGALHEYAESLTRAAVEAMPDGEYEHEDFIDGLGEHPVPIRFRAKITVAGGAITIDWAGTSPQLNGAINHPLATTISVSQAALRCAIGVDVPNCEGFSRVLTVVAEPGSIVNPVEPAACAARGVTSYRLFDVLQAAFAKIVPDRMPALSEGGPSVVSLAGRQNNNAWLITDGILGSWGGGHKNDGPEGISSPLGNLSNQPIELIEARLPIKITRYGFAKDSGGAGEQRGGLAVFREYELLAETATLSLRSDRRHHLPIGLKNGLPGSPSINILSNKDGRHVLPVMPRDPIPLEEGDRILHIAPGGGGYGSPLKRSPERVLEDALDDRISRAFAERVYGVALRGSPLQIDVIETQRLRDSMALEPLTMRHAAQKAIFADTNAIDTAWLV